MCGRYTLSTPAQLIGELFGLEEVPELSPRFNIAPTQEAAVVRSQGGRRALDLLRWGLVPYWAHDPTIGGQLINARAETANQKPAFRSSFARRRCLVAADGFYEWRRTAAGRQPFFVRLEGGRPFAFAGLWDRWSRAGEAVESFAILTTDANRLVAEIHDRMPVILTPPSFDAWLDPTLSRRDSLAALLRPFPAEAMERYPVSTWVNKPENDSPRCIRPAAADSGPRQQPLW